MLSFLYTNVAKETRKHAFESRYSIRTHNKSGAHNGLDGWLVLKWHLMCSVTLLGNILLRSIVVSVLIRLINGYSVTDGT